MSTTNEVLDRAMLATKNLMTIEIKDRRAAIQEKIHILRSDGTLKTLSRHCQEIIDSEKSEILSENPWLQKLVEATQTAMMHLSDYVGSIDDQENALNQCCVALTNDDNIIITENIIEDVIVIFEEDSSLTVKYGINPLLIPWSTDVGFSITNYQLTDDEYTVFKKKRDIEQNISTLGDEAHELNRKGSNMDDILLRVETDLLLKQLKVDSLGERSIDTIKELMDKHLDNKALPEGMSLIK